MKKIHLLNVFLSAVCFVGNYFYTVSSDIDPKILASGAFLLMGIVNYVYMRKKETAGSFHMMLLIGLAFAAMADVALDFTFFAGAALFAMGHVFYFVAQCRLVRFRTADLIPSALLALSVGGFLWFYPKLTYPDAIMRYVVLVYAVIISLMTGKAISDCIRVPGIVTAAVAAGCVLFLFSDLMLALDWFMNSPIANDLCMAAYYPAECILAASLLIVPPKALQ